MPGESDLGSETLFELAQFLRVHTRLWRHVISLFVCQKVPALAHAKVPPWARKRHPFHRCVRTKYTIYATTTSPRRVTGFYAVANKPVVTAALPPCTHWVDIST